MTPSTPAPSNPAPPNPAPAAPTVRWIGPTGGGDLGRCWRLVNPEVHFLEADADLTVLACPRPLVDTASAAELLEEVGAERFVQLLGVWCEGEGRTGRPVEGAPRVFWHAWPGWWRRWRERRAASVVAPTPPRLVRIDSPDGQFARALVATLAEAAVAAVWSRTTLAAEADAILWDGAQMSGREADHLAAVCSAARDRRTPVVAMLDFPRPETVAAAEALGAAAVLGKPFTTELLLDSLSAAIRNAPPHQSNRSLLSQSPRTASPRRKSWEEGWYPECSHDSRRGLATHTH